MLKKVILTFFFLLIIIKPSYASIKKTIINNLIKTENLSFNFKQTIGKKTEEIFLDDGLETIEDLSKFDIFELNKKFGRKTAAWLFNASKGIDNEPVQERQETIQISKISTLKQDSKEYDFLLQSLNDLCKQVHTIVLEKNKLFRSIGIQLVQQDMTNKTRSRMLKNSTSSLEELEKISAELLREALEDQEIPIRRLGVKVSEFSDLEGQSSITSYF